jgi:hypothetical protein
MKRQTRPRGCAHMIVSDVDGLHGIHFQNHVFSTVMAQVRDYTPLWLINAAPLIVTFTTSNGERRHRPLPWTTGAGAMAGSTVHAPRG